MTERMSHIVCGNRFAGERSSHAQPMLSVPMQKEPPESKSRHRSTCCSNTKVLSRQYEKRNSNLPPTAY